MQSHQEGCGIASCSEKQHNGHNENAFDNGTKGTVVLQLLIGEMCVMLFSDVNILGYDHVDACIVSP